MAPYGGLFSRLLTMALPFVTVTACSSGDRGSSSDGMVFRWDEIPHDAVAISMDTVIQGHGDDHRSLAVARARLLGGREEWTYGTIDGPENTVWSWIRDVTTDAEGNVYVLDLLLNLLRVLSPEGELITEAHLSGEGPMEIRATAGADFMEDTLVLFSPAYVIFSVGGPRAPAEARRAFPRSPGTEDACTTDSLLYLKISPFAAEGSILMVDAEGNEVGTFGHVFEHEDASVRAYMSRGQVACGQEADRVFLAADNSSLIRAYSHSGTPAWVGNLVGFRPPEILGEPMGDGRLALSNPATSPEDKVQRLTSLPGGVVLVQVARMGPSESVGGRTIRRVRRRDSYLLSARTGVGVYVGSELPEVLHATATRLFAVDAGVEINGGTEVNYLLLKTYEW